MYDEKSINQEFISACAQGDYHYVEKYLDDVDYETLDNGLKRAVASKHHRIIVRLFRKKITDKTLYETITISIDTKDTGTLHLIVNNAKRQLPGSTLMTCFNRIKDKKQPDNVIFDLIKVLIPYSRIDDDLISFAHYVCIHGYGNILDLLLHKFIRHVDIVFGINSKFNESCAYTAYKHNNLNITRKILDTDKGLYFLSDILNEIKTTKELNVLVAGIKDSINVNEYIFMFSQFELFTQFYEQDPSNRAYMKNIDIYLKQGNKYAIIEKVKFILSYDNDMISVPSYQKGLTNVITNIISNKNNNTTGVKIVSMLLTKVNRIDHMELFKYACTSNNTDSLTCIFNYIRYSVDITYMQNVLIISCRYQKNNSIRFILERAQELNLHLDIDRALNTVLHSSSNHIVDTSSHVHTILCLEAIFSFNQPDVAQLNQFVRICENPSIIEYLFFKGANNINYMYVHGRITDSLERNILKIFMNKSQDKKIHLETLIELNVETYVNNYNTLKRLMNSGISFHKQNMPIVQRIIDENERELITAQMSMNYLPTELRQEITNFVKLPGAFE
jgi:hypothetical protein